MFDDWRDQFAPAIVDGAERTPQHFILHYHIGAERALLRVLDFVGANWTILKFTRKRPRRRGTETRYWLPGYAFLNLDIAADRWQQIRRAPGALRFCGDPPQSISEADFTDMRLRCPEKLAPNDEYTVIPVGSEVEVLNGALQGRTGLVSSSRGKLCMVELVVFFRTSSIELRTRDVRILR